MFMCPNLNVALVEAPLSINLQQDIACIHNCHACIAFPSTIYMD